MLSLTRDVTMSLFQSMQQRMAADRVKRNRAGDQRQPRALLVQRAHPVYRGVRSRGGCLV